jgi:Domain of unknown function (DUF3846)
MDALVIPADPTEPVRVIDLDSGDGALANLQQAVGGFVEVQAHTEGDIWLNDEGSINGSPVNVRASHWVLNDSAMSGEGGVGEWSVLYGDVVVTGPPDREGESTAVDPKLVAYFSDLELAPDVVADWDVRNVHVIVTDWPEMDRESGRDRGGDWDLGF